MGTLLIDRMLDAVCTAKASGLRLTVGSQPMLRLDDGQMQSLASEVLVGADTVSLMKSITPVRCQQQLEECGVTDFGFAFGEMARFRVAVTKQLGDVELLIRRIPDDRQIQTSKG